jgi:hypothetical protein
VKSSPVVEAKMAEPSASKSRDIQSITLTYGSDPLTKAQRPQLSTFDEKQNGMLGLWCLEHGLSVQLGLSGDAAGGNPQTVSVRFATDSMSGPSPAADWLIQRQGGFTFAYLRPDRVGAFRDEMLKAPEVRVEVVNPRNRSVTAYVFSLKGLREANTYLTCPLPKWP